MLKQEMLTVAETTRQITNDLGIDARLAGRCNGLLNVNHAAFDIARHAFFFLLQASCEYDVRMINAAAINPRYVEI